MTNMINVCFITDTNYMIPTGVAVMSLIKNCDENVICNIYIIAVDTDKNLSNKYNKLQTKNVRINVINTDNIYSNIKTTHQHVSKAAMLKFNLPNMFKDLDKILYIDGDVLVLGNLIDLYNTDINKKYAAVVVDMQAMCCEKQHHKKLGLKKYFNSGMMLLNLKKMREDNITKKLLFVKKHDKLQHFMDQDALNKCFNDNVVFVSMKYNCMLQNLDYPVKQIAKFYKITSDEFNKIKDHPVILHLTNKKKPWNSDDVPGYELWNKYYKQYQFKTNCINFLYKWFKRFLFRYEISKNGFYKMCVFGITIVNCKPKFIPDAIQKGGFWFTQEYCPNGRIHIFVCGKKVFSYERLKK